MEYLTKNPIRAQSRKIFTSPPVKKAKVLDRHTVTVNTFLESDRAPM